MVYRKTLDGPWTCSWNCGYKNWDIRKVIEHENKGEHQQIEDSSRKLMNVISKNR